jgi:SAM-dependent methyltransferase
MTMTARAGQTDRDLYKIIEASPMNEWIGSGEAETIAKGNLAAAVDNGVLAETDRVLDFGCGIGRTTVALSEYANQGEVVGVDIVRQMVEFCDKELAPHLPNARFLALDEPNPHYERYRSEVTSSSVPPSTLRLEQFEDQFRNHFDSILAFSVFTHFTPAMAAKFLATFARVLKPNGLVLLTAFIDVPWGKYRLRTLLDLPLGKHELRLADRGHRDCIRTPPLTYAVFGFDRLAVLAAKAGFRICRVVLGARDMTVPPSLRKVTHSQDVVILSRIPSLPPEFDRKRYLAANPDVRAANDDPVKHFLTHGFFEGRPIAVAPPPKSTIPQ